MSNLKKITEVPVVESTENINLLANSNGSAVQVAANKIGAQADWNETDEASPAFIMNKPTSLGGGVVSYYVYNGIFDLEGNKVEWETFVNAFNSGVVRCYDPSLPNKRGTIVGYNISSSGEKIVSVCVNQIIYAYTV